MYEPWILFLPFVLVFVTHQLLQINKYLNRKIIYIFFFDFSTFVQVNQKRMVKRNDFFFCNKQTTNDNSISLLWPLVLFFCPCLEAQLIFDDAIVGHWCRTEYFYNGNANNNNDRKLANQATVLHREGHLCIVVGKRALMLHRLGHGKKSLFGKKIWRKEFFFGIY